MDRILICILQHRNPNYTVTAFLHLFAALRDDDELRRKCKILLACTSRRSPELLALERIFGSECDVEVFETIGSYPEKLRSVVNKYPPEQYQFFVKHDEDILVSRNTWHSFLRSAPAALGDPSNLAATVNLSTGIPSWMDFADRFLHPDERDSLQSMLNHERVPERLWGMNFEMVSRYVARRKGAWDESAYWRFMNAQGAYSKGVHPVRIYLAYGQLLNEAILRRYADFQTAAVSDRFTRVTDRYLCNSFFMIRYPTYTSFMNEDMLHDAKDGYGEVAMNRYREIHDLAFCFLQGSLGVHILYNTTYMQLTQGPRRINGLRYEYECLTRYLALVRQWLAERGETRAHQIPLAEPTPRERRAMRNWHVVFPAALYVLSGVKRQFRNALIGLWKDTWPILSATRSRIVSCDR